MVTCHMFAFYPPGTRPSKTSQAVPCFNVTHLPVDFPVRPFRGCTRFSIFDMACWRRVELAPGVEYVRTADVKDQIELSGNDIQAVSMTGE